MDLNYLFRRQQQERFHAQWSTCTQAQSAHRQMAECYEKQISRLTDGRVTIQPLSTGTHMVADPQGE